ncbi:MAG: hypothetical protein J2P25_21015 [Nocardiopsaceae bacterium]|nr:hypothetical protein [Nocardiopsaceae bacterium]
MKLSHVRWGRADPQPGVVGAARVGRRTKTLVKRLNPGDIAVIDHADLDRVSADELRECKVAAVVNAAKSSTGRYPNLGPRILLEAGIPLLDDIGDEALARIAEGDQVRLDGEVLYDSGGQAVAKGTQLTDGDVREALDAARHGVATQIDSFAVNTLEFLRSERDLLTNGMDVPELATKMDGRHVLVVVRGYRYAEDLRTLRPYIREYRPVMLAVDGGADALLKAGYRPQLIIGDMDSVTDEALTSGAELVVHAYPDGHAPGAARLEALGLSSVPLPAPGTSEDVALLLADACGAALIAVVGTHWTLEEFLDKGRPGMASTFLTHLRVGTKVVNARGVHQLYQSRISGGALLVLVLVAAVTIVVAVASSPAGQILGDYFSATWHSFAYWFTGLLR